MTTKIIYADTLQGRLDEIERQLPELQAQYKDLHAEAEFLRHVLRQAVEANDEDSATNGQYRLRPTEAILAYVRDHPGTTKRDIVRDLAGQIQSQSTNRKRLLYSMIMYLQDKKQALTVTRAGRIRLADGT